MMTVICALRRSTLLLSVLAAASASAQDAPSGDAPPAQPPSFELFGAPLYLTLGAGALLRPAYEGAAAYTVSPLPVIDARWGETLFFNMRDGLGANLYADGGLKLAAAIGVAFGRDEDADGGLRGMGDVDMAAKPSVKAVYTLDSGMFFDLNGFAEAGDGVRFAGSLGAGWGMATAEGFRLSVRAGLGFADAEYMQTYFGVDSGQATRSGYDRFSADGGLYKTTLDLNLSQAVTQNIGVFGLAGFDYLMGDAAESPLNKRRGQFRVGAGVTYTF